MNRGETFPGVVLVGFMGSGKSSVGRVLARRFGAPFVDVDERIESAAGCPIRDLFPREGEPAFREREKAVLRDVLSVKGCVVATGGGAFADEENRDLLRSYAPVIYLEAAVETLLERLAGDLGRPLLRGGDREESGAGVAVAPGPRVSHRRRHGADRRANGGGSGRAGGGLDRPDGGTGGLNPETMTVALGDRSYDIFFGREIYSLFQEWICRFYPGGTVHVVTDRNVASIYGDDIRRWLAGIPHDVLALPPGEEHKNFDTVREIYGFLARGDAGRDSLVVAFGGGVVGDLAGFAAATYLRGISCIQVPTTLLSQVDSSVGGKTGFNLPEGKNLVGAFHQPRAVFIDDAFLRTLDDRNLRAGMAEVVKCALAGDAELWDRLLAVGGKWKSLSGEEWRWVVRRAVGFKASVVERDERETSLRRILNLGHTIGHAMEKSGGYGRLLHGEAVAMGLAWEAILGMKLGVTGEELVDDLVSLLIGMGFPLDDPGVALTSIAAAIGMDKKRMMSDVDLPLVAAPGRCELRRVPLAEIRRELPGIRAEIRERSIARELNIPAEECDPGRVPGFEPCSRRGRGVRDPSRRGERRPRGPRGSRAGGRPGTGAGRAGIGTGAGSRRAGTVTAAVGNPRRARRADRDPGRPVLVPGRAFHREADRRGDPPRRPREPPGPGVVGGPDRGRSPGGGSPRVPRDHGEGVRI